MSCATKKRPTPDATEGKQVVVARVPRQPRSTIPRSSASAVVRYGMGVIPPEDAARFMAALKQLPLQHDKIFIGGEMRDEPRLTLAASTTGKPYHYVKKLNKPVAFTPELLELKRIVEQWVGGGVTFDLALVVLYRHGHDSLSWHSDDGTDIKLDYIASVSLGVARRFRIRFKDNHNDTRDYTLGAGDLFLMHGACQERLQHCVHRCAEAADAGERISVTFRRYK